MNISKNRIFSLLIIAILVSGSCKKPAANTATPQCQLQSLTGINVGSSEKINYGSDNGVLGVELIGGPYTSLVPHKDVNSNVSRIDYYFNSTLVIEKYVQYDVNNRATLFSTYSNGQLSAYQSWTYTNGNRPTGQKIYSIDNNGNTVLKSDITFTYDSRGNVLTAGNTSYTYDDKTNAESVLKFLPDVVYGNANNMTSQTTRDQNGSVTSSINSTYVYDGNGNVSQREDINNIGVSSSYIYLFQCH